jgi:phage terminase Nu1 subunit (DNA packaging protein)
MKTIVTKAQLAEELRVSRPRVTQYLQQGLPVREDGRINLAEALNWILANIEPADGGGAVEVARELLAGRANNGRNGDDSAAEGRYFTANEAADLLERDRRTVNRALRHVPPDNRNEQGRVRWRIATVVQELAALDRAAPGPAGGATAEEIERVARELDAGLERLCKENDLEKCRELVRDGVGPLVGKLDRALERGAAGTRPNEQELLRIVRNQIIGGAIGTILDRCRWELKL